MMALDHESGVLHRDHHFAAQVLVVIRGRHRKITFAEARTVAQVIFRAPGVPAAFFGIDEIEPVLFALIEAYVVEDEELGFRAEVGSIGDAGGGKIKLGFACDVARITIVALLGHWVDDIGDHNQCRDLSKRIEQRRTWIGDQ